MTLCFNAIAEQEQAAQSRSPKSQTAIEQAKELKNATTLGSATVPEKSLTVLKQYSGKNLSEMNLTLFSAVNEFGIAGLGIGEAIKFKAPKTGWKLKGISIVGWSGFNNTTKLFPADRTFLVEVRDNNADLLYRFVDIQNIYFASTKGPVTQYFDIPALPVTEDFYVTFYDRGSMGLVTERENGIGNSFFVINGQLIPAEFKTNKTNETLKVNWLIMAVGE